MYKNQEDAYFSHSSHSGQTGYVSQMLVALSITDLRIEVA